MNTWQPIETAPKDGTWIVLGGGFYTDDYVEPRWTPDHKYDHSPSGHIMIARWVADLKEEFSGGQTYGAWAVAVGESGYVAFTYDDPTVWMPCPSLHTP